MKAAKTTASLALCLAFIAAVSFWLGLYGEPVSAAIWSDLIWGW